MKIRSLLILGVIGFATATTSADNHEIKEGLWKIEVESSNGKITISHNDKEIFNDVYANATYNLAGASENYEISSLSYGKMPEITDNEVSDNFGNGRAYIFSYPDERVTMKHTFTFYDALPYFIVQLSLERIDGGELQSNNLKALAVNSSSMPLNGASNRMVLVPFDNDGHIKYEVYQLKDSKEVVSHEVGYVFDGESRRGIVAGSVDHDLWKSGVTIAGTGGYKIEKFECLSGLTNSNTRDILPHGKVKGSKVSSSRFFVGVYDDWREGLNEFAEANTKVAEPAEWTAGNPFGWSSWGVQQNYINYDGVEESARFIKENLFDLGFHDRNGQTVISLDAFAGDNIPSAKLYSLGTKVFGVGSYKEGQETKEGTNQILGQYGGHLVAWSWSLDSKVPGTGLNGTPDYTYRDITLKVNGKPYSIGSNGGYAVDPTHPAVKANVEYFLKQCNTNGTKYLKMDFLNDGIIEGDSWYDPNVTTGVQAYNYGMKLFYEEAQKYGMYIVESISPIFPYQYAHGRRTCCDRFSEIGETEYVMNAMTYGWWTDKLYTVNDPDQLVMCKGDHGARETLGENRARATSGMATGAFIFGDNFSDNVLYTDNNGHTKGTVVGYPEESRKRAIEIMGNQDINDYVRNNTGSFMPVDGHHPSSGQSAESMFMRRTDDYLYLAVFNYGNLYDSKGSMTFERLGITKNDVSEIKELWTGEKINIGTEEIEYNVPPKDVRVYRMTLGVPDAGIDEIRTDEDFIKFTNIGRNIFKVRSNSEISFFEVSDISGKKVISNKVNHTESLIDLSSVAPGIYLINTVTSRGKNKVNKVIVR